MARSLVAKAVQTRFEKKKCGALFITPGSPWENSYMESVIGKWRYEVLNGEIFYSLAEARIVIESWRQHYNTKRPHSSLGYRPPAPEVLQWPAPPSGLPHRSIVTWRRGSSFINNKP